MLDARSFDDMFVSFQVDVVLCCKFDEFIINVFINNTKLIVAIGSDKFHQFRKRNLGRMLFVKWFLVCHILFIFSTQRKTIRQEQSVEQTFVVDSSRLLSFAVGYSIEKQLNVNN
jgi:hypothetical protein